MDVECEWKCPLESRGIEAVVVGVAAMAVVEEAAAMEEVVEAVVDQGRVTLRVLRHNQPSNIYLALLFTAIFCLCSF